MTDYLSQHDEGNFDRPGYILGVLSRVEQVMQPPTDEWKELFLGKWMNIVWNMAEAAGSNNQEYIRAEFAQWASVVQLLEDVETMVVNSQSLHQTKVEGSISYVDQAHLPTQLQRKLPLADFPWDNKATYQEFTDQDLISGEQTAHKAFVFDAGLLQSPLLLEEAVHELGSYLLIKDKGYVKGSFRRIPINEAQRNWLRDIGITVGADVDSMSVANLFEISFRLLATELGNS